MKSLLTALPAALLLSLQPVQAKDVKDRHAAIGPGADQCANFTAARRGNPGKEYDYRLFISGYFSAFNVIVPNTYDIMGGKDMDELVRWMDDYCAARPNELFVNAVAQLTVAMYELRYNLPPATP